MNLNETHPVVFITETSEIKAAVQDLGFRYRIIPACWKHRPENMMLIAVRDLE